MSWWTILRADLTRTPMRTILTVVSLVLAFVLFGLLQPIRVMFNEGIDLGADKRLIVTPKHSVADMLPVRHGGQIESIDSVAVVAHMTWFGGTYQDPQNFFPQFAVTPEEFLQVNPEVMIDADQTRAFVSNRRGAIVGRATAERFGWQIGDTISLIPNIWHNHEGAAWDFELVGIFKSSNKSVIAEDGFYFGYPFFDEYRAFGTGSVGSFVVQVNDVAQLRETAALVDAQFANSSAETRTQSSAEYALGFARQMGDVGAMATIILIAVLFTLLMLTGHAMTRTVHERTAELAAMRVLGFKTPSLALLLVSEFAVLAIGAAAIGLILAHAIALQLEELMPQISQLGGIGIGINTALQGLLLALVIGIGVAVLPVSKALLRPIVPALRVEV